REIQYTPRLNVDFKLLYTLRKGKARLRYLVYFGKKALKQTFPQENYQPFQLKGLLRPDTNGLISRIVESEMEIDSFASKLLHPSMDSVISHVKKSGIRFDATQYVKDNFGSLILKVYKFDFTSNQDFENWVHTQYPKITFTTTPKVYKRNGTVNKAGLARTLRTMISSIEDEKRGPSAYTKAISKVLKGEN
ncbi:MAG TPA: hypothetical protein VLA13_08605, partial [Massilibacterium sp.]|nr:hypothetical protein [Massilibacterium sp.]